MSVSLDPLVSEFESEEQAESYDRWFRAKVRETMESGSSVPHDQAVARISALLAEKRGARDDDILESRDGRGAATRVAAA